MCQMTTESLLCPISNSITHLFDAGKDSQPDSHCLHVFVTALTGSHKAIKPDWPACFSYWFFFHTLAHCLLQSSSPATNIQAALVHKAHLTAQSPIHVVTDSSSNCTACTRNVQAGYLLGIIVQANIKPHAVIMPQTYERPSIGLIGSDGVRSSNHLTFTQNYNPKSGRVLHIVRCLTCTIPQEGSIRCLHPSHIKKECFVN